MSHLLARHVIGTLLLTLATACAPVPPDPAAPEADDGAVLRLPFEKYVLDNGLEVVLHQDHSDPIVAVAMLYHVGSSRETPGRTGFAHLFEHLLFQNSENVGPGGFVNGVPALGGTFNGGTSNDTTIYFEVVPNDALERVLWMESDRLGFFIKTVNEPSLENEKQIVKNEKRQGVDNRPYGHTSYVVDSNLFPEGHPYSWQVIGSLDDLQAATLEDVRAFYERYYGPQNATLVIAGDFEPETARTLVETYFGEIAAGPEVTPRGPAPGVVSETIRLVHEDNFAQMPMLTMAWPTVEAYHPDSYALDALSALLARGRTSPFYQVVVEEDTLAPAVNAGHPQRELAGQFQLSARAFPATDLDNLLVSFDRAFDRFETDGVNQADLQRITAGLETDFYNGISSVLGKSFQLANYNVLAGDPGFVTEDLQRLRAVSADDVLRVYRDYIAGQPSVITSFVPRGGADAALEGSGPAAVVEEAIIDGAEPTTGSAATAPVERTPSRIDRATPPPLGPSPQLPLPEVWSDEIANGMRVYGIEHHELPLVQFSIRLHGGRLLEDPNRLGVANLITDMLMEGTAARTPEELEVAIEELGASITLATSSEAITLRANTLTRNYAATLALAEEILLEPRWDTEAFELVRERTISDIRQRAASPPATGAAVFNRLVYGPGHILSHSPLGTIESVSALTLDDLRDYYAASFSPSVAVMHVAGDITQAAVLDSLGSLASRWAAHAVAVPVYPLPERPGGAPRLYFVDVPNAPQSVITVGQMALARTDDDYYPATVMNHRLGGGITSRFFQRLRIERGYTYGASAAFRGQRLPAPFVGTTSVRANVTYDSVALIKEILEDYGVGYTEEDLTGTRDELIRGNLRSFETLGSLVGMLQNISAYDLPPDYISRQEATIAEMTVEDVRALAGTHLDPDRMIYVVVGDAQTQLARLADLGLGVPMLVDREAREELRR
ncbi:MAG: peptidase M16 [Acidobacteria bacterium]|jgi:zinc protease|nr:peptidase M16 [Acidobacteriota bacterium]MDP7480109.1 pitrilysin family protein [Vicinamibacterales bacterium]MDP7690357.1 pitrilysin family protein [Vicinamibacterales bacterium]HJN45507.1 pitrilysin family protein [Vicinamibacterales bacterium]